MGNPPTAIGFEQNALGVALAEKDGCGARMRRLIVDVVVRIGRADGHDAMSPRTTGAVAGSNRSLTTFQILSATACRESLASMSTQRRGSLIAISLNPSRSFSWYSNVSLSNRSGAFLPKRILARASPISG